MDNNKTEPTEVKEVKQEYVCELDGKVFTDIRDLLHHIGHTYKMPIYSYFAIITEQLQKARERVAELEEKIGKEKWQ